MKRYLYTVIMGLFLALFSAGSAHAEGNKAEVLSDKQLGSIEGGYCLFWKCEDSPGTGSCQPVKNDTIDLCKTVKCKLVVDMDGNTEVLQCVMTGGTETCTEASTYVQCIRSKQPTLCIRNFEAKGCGLLVQTYCLPDIKHRQCFCGSSSDTTPCDWTSCVN